MSVVGWPGPTPSATGNVPLNFVGTFSLNGDTPWCSFTQPQSWQAGAMRWRGLRWMGTIAYGGYRLHLQILLAVYAFLWSCPPESLGARGETAAVIAAFGLTTATCSASWLFFEKPLVHLGHRDDY